MTAPTYGSSPTVDHFERILTEFRLWLALAWGIMGFDRRQTQNLIAGVKDASRKFADAVLADSQRREQFEGDAISTAARLRDGLKLKVCEHLTKANSSWMRKMDRLSQEYRRVDLDLSDDHKLGEALEDYRRFIRDVGLSNERLVEQAIAFHNSVVEKLDVAEAYIESLRVQRANREHDAQERRKRLHPLLGEIDKYVLSTQS